MNRTRALALVATAALSVSLSGALAGCSTAVDSSAPAPAASAVKAGAQVIDVRTPAEYADGHLTGAANLDVTSPSFDAQIAALPKASTYVVYCRSGNRSAQAKTRMESAGFTNVIDAGGVREASDATGLSVVKG